MERLQKFLSECGVASRRKSEELIVNGKVKVNGVIVKTLGVKVSDNDIVMVNGEVVKKDLKEYYLLYKPRGIISSVKDEKGRKTVVDLVDVDSKIYPVGRLDYDTTGAILLTNDGELSNLLTHPNSNVNKEYVAKVKGFFKKNDAILLSKGILLDGKKTKPGLFKLKKYDKKTDSSYVKVVISEGRKHQVKDMFSSLGYEVLKLKRERYAFLNLNGLKSGQYRKLSLKEVKQLYSLKQKNKA